MNCTEKIEWWFYRNSCTNTYQPLPVTWLLLWFLQLQTLLLLRLLLSFLLPIIIPLLLLYYNLPLILAIWWSLMQISIDVYKWKNYVDKLFILIDIIRRKTVSLKIKSGDEMSCRKRHSTERTCLDIQSRKRTDIHVMFHLLILSLFLSPSTPFLQIMYKLVSIRTWCSDPLLHCQTLLILCTGSSLNN